MKIKCQNCGYEWNTSSSMEMVTCPSCGYKTPKTGDVLSRPERRDRSQLQSRRGPKEVNILSTKWAGAIALLIAVAIGAWGALVYLGGEAPSSGTGEKKATIGLEMVGGTTPVFAASEPDNSGIENIYIVNISETTFTNDFSSYTANIENVITNDGDSVNIDYDEKFYIVVAVKGHENEMAYVAKENMYIYGYWSSGDLSTEAAENTHVTDNKYQFDSGTDAGGKDWIEVNHVLVNNDDPGEGWVLRADESSEITVDYWLYR